MKTAIDSGASDTALWQQFFPQMVRSDQAFKRYRASVTPQRDGSISPLINVFWGPSGSGKSSACPRAGSDVYWSNCSKWFDGYYGQSTIVFDEFYGQIMYSDMLRIVDRHPFQVDTKGSIAVISAKIFYFTSNVHPKNFWKRAQEAGTIDISPWLRRLEEFGNVVEMTHE